MLSSEVCLCFLLTRPTARYMDMWRYQGCPTPCHGPAVGDLDSGSSSVIHTQCDVVQGSVLFCISVASAVESGSARMFSPHTLPGSWAISQGHPTVLPLSADTLSGASSGRGVVHRPFVAESIIEWLFSSNFKNTEQIQGWAVLTPIVLT